MTIHCHIVTPGICALAQHIFIIVTGGTSCMENDSESHLPSTLKCHLKAVVV